MKKLILNSFKRVISVILTAMLLLSTISFEVFAVNPKVSIIIPVYNTPENLLRDCLESAKNQTLKDIEIICVDDGSTDDSGKILDEYSKNDSRFVVVHQENAGVSVARNKGMEIAKGEYIKFLDSDDMIDAVAAEKSYNVAKEYDADIVKYSMKPVERGASQFHVKYQVNDKFEVIDDSNPSISKVLKYRNAVSAYLGVYKNKFLKDNNLRFLDNLQRGEDQCFNILCFSRACKFVFMPDKLYSYRFNSMSIMAGGNKNKRKTLCMVDVIKYIYEYFKNFGYFSNNKAKIEFLNLILTHRIFLGAINNGNLNKLINFLLKSELLQDDVINQLPSALKTKLKLIMNSVNPQARPEKPIPDGIYTISSNLDPEKCLAIAGSSKNDKANLQLWQKNGGNNQKFKIEYNPDGYYTIKAMCSGKFIDVAASGKKNGTNIWQYSSNGTDAQKWFIVPDGEGYYCLVSKCNNLCMDDSSARAKNRANIHCWSIHGGDSQRFKLEKCEDKPSSNNPTEAKKKAVKPSSNNPAETKKEAAKPSSNNQVELKKSA